MTIPKKKQDGIDRSWYDYMDSMGLDGWMWEFIKRSISYRDLYMDIASELSDNADHNESILEEYIPKLEKEGIQPISWSFPVESAEELLSDCFMYWEVSGSQVYSPGHPSSKQFKGIPDLDERFDRLINSNEFSAQDSHFIAGLTPFKSSYFRPTKKDYESNYRQLVEKLAMYSPEDTFYIGISRTVKFEDLEEQLLPYLKTVLNNRTQRIRSNKWKPYLIAYDLRGAGYTYDKIAYHMSQAYPDDELLLDARNVENYSKAADALISGDYKDFLYLPD